MRRLYRATFRGRWRGRGDDWAEWTRTYVGVSADDVRRQVYDLYDVDGPITVTEER